LTAPAHVITGSLASQPARKINIATPAYGATYSSVYVKSLFSLISSAPARQVAFSFSEIDYADVVTARNYLISNFYFNKTDCSHILFIDDDMGFEYQLIYEMLGLQQDYVGVIAPRRSIDLKKLHALGGEPFPQAVAKACHFIGSPKPAAGSGDFVEVNQCGTGILLLSRRCIATMIAKCPEIVDTQRFKKLPIGPKFTQFITPFDKIQLEHSELSEDLSFAHRWTQFCGGKIFANVSRPIQHMTAMALETRFADLQQSRQLAASQLK